ncbi:hypothetical protein [Roseateles sp.]|uniref:hypothetical protein n=1 Tax=Roseateles sp. TaxID=1971397 RepID=UPI00286B5CCC|nr:hypothetical protein [Roseateles sp.]
MKSVTARPKAGLEAVARLSVTRELLCQSLRQNLQQRSGGKSGGSESGGSGFQSLPAVALLLEAARAWAQGQPLRMSAALLADTFKASLAPLAKRHPLSLVFGVAALAGLLVWARPWRWGLVKPALLAGLAQQLLSKALNGVSLEGVLAMFTRFAQPPSAGAPVPPPPP